VKGWRWWRLKLRSLVDRRRLDRELREEMEGHLAMEIEAGVRAGLSPAEAWRRARAAFGGVERHREEAQEQWAFRLLDDALRDLRHTLRSLARTPAFTAVAVLTLALGLGANTAIFSVLHGVLLAPPPFADAGRLALVWETDRASGTRREPASVPDFFDFEARSESFAALAAFQGREVTWRAPGGEPRRLAALAVSHDLPAVVGVEPVLGRAPRPEDDLPSAAPVVWIAKELWETGWGRDPAVAGSVVEIDGVASTVAGVMPRGADFGFAQVLARADYGRSFGEGGEPRVALWVPLQPDARVSPRSTHPIFVLGRLAPGASVEGAGEEMAAIAADLEAAHPDNRHRGVHVEALTDAVLGPVRPALWLLLAAVGLVLVIACVNVVSLLLARSAARRREVAVRAALGAGSRRLGRQFLVEGLVIAAAAALFGTGAAVLALAGLRAAVPGELAPRLAEVRLETPVLAASLAAAALAGLLFAGVPWLQARRGASSSALHGAAGRVAGPGRDGARSRGLLVVAEIALAVVLVVGAGLLLRSFLRITGVELGFRTADVVKAEVQLPAARYPRDFSVWPDWPEIQGFHAAVLDGAEAIPGAAAAALAGAHPLAAGYTNSFVIEGREMEAADQPEIAVRPVSPAYFDVAGVPLAAGRAFTAADRGGAAGVAIVNRAAARRFFPEGALGERVAFWGISREVVGVVGNERFHGPRAEAPPALYVPLAQAPAWDLSLLVRTEPGQHAAELAPALRRAVTAADPALAVFGVETLEAAFGRSLAQLRFVAALVALFAGLALLLALIGVHGVLAYTVAQRRREMGIRMALGAARRDVLGLVLGDGLRYAAAGLGLGLLAALGAARGLEGLLFEVEPADPVTLAGVAGAVLAAALLASLAPALGATRTDPVRTLQED
jgi:putative ABC transport system permease protein